MLIHVKADHLLFASRFRGAEAFHSFMERCMDPMVPASIHSVPQKYNLPNRMWNSAFLLLFEHLLSALRSPADTETFQSVPLIDATNQADSAIGNVVDHLTDFVYYAYTFYTQLLEQQSLSAFRGTWIEHLGDIARYRMAIAEVSGRLPPASGLPKVSAPGNSLRSLFESVEHDAEPRATLQDTADRDQIPQKQLVSRKDRKKGFPGMPVKLGEDLELADTPGNSIGAAALDDWELVEHEIWRTVSQDWYFLGLSETPGTGRLHHHLALLAEDDELRALYHYSKG